MKSLSLSLRSVLCCVAVEGISLLHCAWLVVRVGVLCCIESGADPRTPLLRCARPHHCAWLCCARKRAVRIVAGGDPRTVSLSLLFAHLPALHDIYEAPNRVAVLRNPPACGASRLWRLESEQPHSAFCFGGLGLRRRPLALGRLNARCYQTNEVREYAHLHLKVVGGDPRSPEDFACGAVRWR